jgi:CshA-type fibril repeat protein
LTPVIPQPPVANPDTNTGDWDTNQTISPLTNDTAGDVTAPLVASTVKLCGVSPLQTPNNCTQTSLTIANQGTYTVNANGTVTFDPLPTFNGTATAVRYQVADTLGQVANTTITPTVRAPRAPTPTPDTNSGNWDTNQTISPLTNDTPGEPTAPLVVTTVKLCGVAPSAQTPNNCTQTSLRQQFLRHQRRLRVLERFRSLPAAQKNSTQFLALVHLLRKLLGVQT